MSKFCGKESYICIESCTDIDDCTVYSIPEVLLKDFLRLIDLTFNPSEYRIAFVGSGPELSFWLNTLHDEVPF